MWYNNRFRPKFSPAYGVSYVWVYDRDFPHLGINFKEYNLIFFIFTQIIVLNKYCTYTKPIPKISHFCIQNNTEIV